MAASGDVPESLLQARRALDEFGEVRIVQDWHQGPEGWRLRINLTPQNLGTVFPIPATTPWYVVVEPIYPGGLINLFPAADDGIVETYWHQLPNLPPLPERPYRRGKMCVATDSEGNLRNNREAEPRTVVDRLAWHVTRACGWLADASNGLLMKDGDWFELPFYRGLEPGRTFAFREGPEPLQQWAGASVDAGFADVVRLPTGIDVATEFRSFDGDVLVRPEWGQAIRGARLPVAMWLRFPDVVALPPHQAPWTWGDLRAVADKQGFDLDAAMRRGTLPFHNRAIHLVLVGFAVPEKIGEPARQMHWQAIELPVLEHRLPRGAPRTPDGWWAMSRGGALGDDVTINWRPSENWHPDQLATRGRLAPDLTAQRVLLIGAGALGSPIGELLVRAGVTNIVPIDGEALIAGNLVRHVLTMNDLGFGKADGLARRLGALSPNVQSMGVNANFPPGDPEGLATADLVIDTTGNHEVLTAIEAFPWEGEPTIASFSIAMHARRLFAYLAKGSGFTVANFDAAYEPYAREEHDRDEDHPWEGIGCFHPVFPARADQVWMMASAAVSLLDDQWPVASDSSVFHVFEREADGSGRFTGIRKIAP